LEISDQINQVYDIVIVIPTLNEEKGIISTINSVEQALKEKFTYKIVVVDGLSSDNTVKIAEKLGAKVIRQRRKGYGDALQAGFYFVDTRLKSKITVMLDADGTYEPADIVKMADIILSGEADFVIGNRFAKMDKNSMTRLNKFGNKLLSATARKLLGIKISDTQCGLRAFRTDLANIFYTSALGMPFATEMLAATYSYRIKIKEIPTSYHERIGKTKLTPFQDGLGILGTIIRLMRDTRPLSLFGSIGLLLISIGIFTGSEVIVEYLQTQTVQRVPTAILSALLVILGGQSISLGLISDMIKSKTHDKRIFYSE